VSADAIGPDLPRRRRLAFVGAAAALSIVGLPIAAVAQPSRGVAGGLATRSVSHYLDLERGLLDDLARRDRAAVQGRLAEDFASRSPDSDEVHAAEDWLTKEFAAPPIVSFLLDRTPEGRGHGSTWFVVDVWRRSTDRLIARSISRPAAAPPRPSRPSGKE
jgi:hypothetical protein